MSDGTMNTQCNMEYSENIDCSDIPEIKDFSKGHLRNPQKLADLKSLIRRSNLSAIDTDNFDWLKSDDFDNYQKRVNDALRWAHANGCPIPAL